MCLSSKWPIRGFYAYTIDEKVNVHVSTTVANHITDQGNGNKSANTVLNLWIFLIHWLIHITFSRLQWLWPSLHWSPLCITALWNSVAVWGDHLEDNTCWSSTLPKRVTWKQQWKQSESVLSFVLPVKDHLQKEQYCWPATEWPSAGPAGLHCHGCSHCQEEPGNQRLGVCKDKNSV